MTAEMRPRNPFIAALLSFFFLGLGQVYNGKGALGIAFFIIYGALYVIWALSGWPRRFTGFVALIIAATVFLLFNIVHAFIQARRIRETRLKRYQTIPVYAFFLILSFLSSFIPVRIWMSPLGVSPYKIATTAMMPTLHEGDLLMADLKAYKGQAPERGDLVVFDYPPDPTKQFVKRVVAIEGDLIEVKAKQVYIDGEPLQESYKYLMDPSIDNSRDNYGPLRVPAGQCFVLGDNRDNSMDSRYWGTLPLTNIIGKASYIYWAKDKKRIGLTLK